MEYNFRKNGIFRCAFLVLTLCVMLCIVLGCFTLLSVRSMRKKWDVALSGISVPKSGEISVTVELMRLREEQKNDRNVFGKLALPGFSGLGGISLGFDMEALRRDLKNLDLLNEDEQKVIDATYISAYKQVIVIKLPMGYNGASFGVIFLGDKVSSIQTVRHEYGHTRQLKKMGTYLYTVDVALPSVIANLLDRAGKLKYDYYGSYWEAGADELGGVVRSTNNQKWPSGADSSIWKLCEMID